LRSKQEEGIRLLEEISSPTWSSLLEAISSWLFYFYEELSSVNYYFFLFAS